MQAANIMMKIRKETLPEVELGTLVSLKMGPRYVTNAKGVLGFVCEKSYNAAGGIKVVTEYGVITAGSRGGHYIPAERYIVLPRKVTIEEGLQVLRDGIRAGTFEMKSCGKISMKVAHNRSFARVQRVMQGLLPLADHFGLEIDGERTDTDYDYGSLPILSTKFPLVVLSQVIWPIVTNRGFLMTPPHRLGIWNRRVGTRFCIFPIRPHAL